MKALLYFYILIFPFFAFARGNEGNDFGIISGTISTADGQGASYVSVFIKNTGKGTTTDNKGNFEIRKIRPGTYVLNISLSGYIDSAIKVDVKQNETVFLKVQLRGTYAELKAVIVAASLHQNYVETKTSESLRLNLPLIEVPQNIEVTSHQILSDQGLLSISEAIRTVSGVEKTSGELNDYSLIIRGTDATNNIFRNGVGGYAWNQQEDIAMLEKIEFVKGPAGFMISFAEPGGVVNNVTKQPVKEPIATINTGFGSYNLMRLTADFGGPLNKTGKLCYRFNTGIHTQERAFQLSKAYRYFICAAIKYEPNEKTSVTAEYNYMYGKTSGNNTLLPSVNGKIFALPHKFTVADAGTDALHATDKYYRIALKHTFSDNLHLNAQVAYMNGFWGGYTLNADGDVPVSNDTLYRAANFEDWRNFSKVAQVFFDAKFNTGHKIEHKVLAGLDYANAGARDAVGGTWGEQKFGVYIPHPDYYINQDSLKHFEIDSPTIWRWQWITLYMQDHIKIAGKLVLSLATHLTHASLSILGPDVPDYQKKTTYNLFSPRVGITWLFSNDISVYALYDECFWPQIAQTFQSKPILPLTGYDVETGLKSYFFHRNLGLDLSVYNIGKNNTLTPDPLHYGYYVETGEIQSKGIDLDITGNICPALTVNMNYEYADAKIIKDNDPNMIGMRSPGPPDHDGNLWLKYSLLHGSLKNISFAMGYQDMGKRSAVWNWVPGDKIQFLPVYNLLDAALSYHNEKFNISLNVYNITNINYATFGYFNSATNEWRYTPGEPVNFRLSFGVNLINRKKDKYLVKKQSLERK